MDLSPNILLGRLQRHWQLLEVISGITGSGVGNQHRERKSGNKGYLTKRVTTVDNCCLNAFGELWKTMQNMHQSYANRAAREIVYLSSKLCSNTGWNLHPEHQPPSGISSLPRARARIKLMSGEQQVFAISNLHSLVMSPKGIRAGSQQPWLHESCRIAGFFQLSLPGKLSLESF